MSLVNPVAVLLPGPAGEKPAKRLEVAVKEPVHHCARSEDSLCHLNSKPPHAGKAQV